MISLDLEGNLQKYSSLNVTCTLNSLELFSPWAFRHWLFSPCCGMSSGLLSFPLTDSSQTVPSLSEMSSCIQNILPSTSFHICPFIPFVLGLPRLSLAKGSSSWSLNLEVAAALPCSRAALLALAGGTLHCQRDEILEHEQNT